MTKDTRILLGRIRGAHGIRGEVVIESYTASKVAIGDYGDLEDEPGKRRFRLKGVRDTGKGVVARIDGVSDRDTAEALIGTTLYVTRDRLPPPEDGEWYLYDLVDLAVTVADISIGVVTDVVNYGAGDLLEVTLTATRETVLVPFTKAIVPVVNIAGGSITIDPPPGLFDDPADAEPDGPVDHD